MVLHESKISIRSGVPPLEKKWLEEGTGLNNYPEGQRFSPLAPPSADFNSKKNFFCFRMDHMNLDRFLVVYDLRNMQQLTPVPVFIDPCFLHYHTMTSTSVMVASQVKNLFFLGEIKNIFYSKDIIHKLI